MMTNMIDVVNNVASALRETRPIHVDPDLLSYSHGDARLYY